MTMNREHNDVVLEHIIASLSLIMNTCSYGNKRHSYCIIQEPLVYKIIIIIMNCGWIDHQNTTGTQLSGLTPVLPAPSLEQRR